MTTVLVIDDSSAIRDYLEEILELRGFDVLLAVDGREGIRLAQEAQPQVILCDIRMPNLDGYQVLQELQNNPLTATIPFIFLTGCSGRQEWRQGMKLGADDYITKPFETEELFNAIETRLRKSASRSSAFAAQIQQLQEGLTTLINYDAVTHLLNTEGLQNRFAELQPLLADTQQTSLLVMVGINQLNWLRGIYGSEFAHKLLYQIAHRLEENLASLSSVAAIAYPQPNQFVFLLIDDNPQKVLGEFFQQLQNQFQWPWSLEQEEFWLTTSAGVAINESGDHSLIQLLNQGEVAMYKCQTEGGSNYCIYEPAMMLNATERLLLEGGLRQALRNDELEMYYQPQVSLNTGLIIGAEALLRWHHPRLGLITPPRFISIAEETGLIVPLGEWVLRQACLEAKQWLSLSATPITVAVNISVHQLQHHSFLEMFQNTMENTAFPPRNLELEVVENVLLQNNLSNVNNIESLKNFGISIAIDDFGTGYASLQYLQQFSFDKLKIDRCFITGVDTNKANRTIVDAILRIAHKLNLRVVAEGVETEEELQTLKQYGCDYIQGYYFSRPLPASEFRLLLQKTNQQKVSSS